MQVRVDDGVVRLEDGAERVFRTRSLLGRGGEDMLSGVGPGAVGVGLS